MDEEKKTGSDPEQDFRGLLSTAVEGYTEEEGPRTLSTLLGVLLFGAAVDCLVSVPLTTSRDGELLPTALTSSSGKRYAAILSEPNEAENAAGEVPIRLVFEALCAAEENLSGLVIDPFGANIRIPAVFFTGHSTCFRPDRRQPRKWKRKTRVPTPARRKRTTARIIPLRTLCRKGTKTDTCWT